ncbi:MAG TPA: hypothetical protein VHE59_06130 [Mucilaginibacter sp.]|nr:hypothetical protein [Mucilaginibacter sp.]
MRIDPHNTCSSFRNSPLYPDPALTGQFRGDLRTDLTYRSSTTTSYFRSYSRFDPDCCSGINLVFGNAKIDPELLQTNRILQPLNGSRPKTAQAVDEHNNCPSLNHKTLEANIGYATRTVTVFLLTPVNN